MRIYLIQTKEIVSDDGARHVARGGAFYNFPEEMAQAWIQLGHAKPATDKNEIIEPEPAAPQEEPALEPVPEEG